MQTAIEAPFRLVISPTGEGRWVHATGPVAPRTPSGHVELWHTRLASAPTADGGEPDEDDAAHRDRPRDLDTRPRRRPDWQAHERRRIR